MKKINEIINDQLYDNNVPIQRAKRALTFKHECYEKSFSVIP